MLDMTEIKTVLGVHTFKKKRLLHNPQIQQSLFIIFYKYIIEILYAATNIYIYI